MAVANALQRLAKMQLRGIYKEKTLVGIIKTTDGITYGRTSHSKRFLEFPTEKLAISHIEKYSGTTEKLFCKIQLTIFQL